MTAYLFAHFIGEGMDQEQVYFSVSKDGLHWEDLHHGQPVLKSSIGDEGVRDPFMVKNEKEGRYYLIATDLRVGKDDDWQRASERGSRSIIVWESSDLINWSSERACEVGVKGAGCVWAPEAIYDKDKEAFLVFWASNVKAFGESEPKQRIYASYTKDFRQFTSPEKYIERDNHIIDTNIIKSNGVYYRFSKNETTKTIEMEKGRSLDKDAFKSMDTPVLDDLFGVEGPECYQLPDGQWCLIVDQFEAGLGYLPILIEDLETAQMRILSKDAYDFGKTKKRHGGVIKISDNAYERLMHFYGKEG